MLDRTPLKDRKPFDLLLLTGIDPWMQAINDVYSIESNYINERDRLAALKKYIFKSEVDNTFLSHFVFGDIPDSWTYQELRDRLLIIIVKGISDSYKNSKKSFKEYVPTNIEQFFDSITQDKQDVYDLCEKYGLKWDTVKNFSRHDIYCRTRGIVRSKTDKFTKITYVFRDPNKNEYGREYGIPVNDYMLYVLGITKSDLDDNLDLDSFD